MRVILGKQTYKTLWRASSNGIPASRSPRGRLRSASYVLLSPRRPEYGRRGTRTPHRADRPSLPVVWEDDRATSSSIAGACAVLQRDRAVQGRSSISPDREPEHPQVPRVRADLQELAYGLRRGGAKGGSNFDPKGKSDAEVMRFCQAFMTELSRHIGADVDVPAGDIGVGVVRSGTCSASTSAAQRVHRHADRKACPTGEPHPARATGYGCVYFVREMLKTAATTSAARCARCRAPATWPSTRSRRRSNSGRRW